MNLRARLRARKIRSHVAIATELLREPQEKHYGYELSRKSGAGAVKLYPYLTKLHEAGYIEDGWEDPSDTAGRPPRRYYCLTASGKEALGRFVEQHSV